MPRPGTLDSVRAEERRYYELRAPEYDDWYLGRGQHEGVDRPGWDAELARHGGPWFAGNDYSALDSYVFTLCRWTRNFTNETPARGRPHLGPYLQRMLERPAVQRVIANEKLAPPLV